MRNISVKCDKCCRSHDIDEIEAVPPGFRVLSLNAAHGDSGRRFDICTACVSLLQYWFERMPNDVARLEEREAINELKGR